jgi:hypothetical protein
MASIQKINEVLCITIAKLDDVLEANIKKVDDINFCTLNCRTGTLETGTYSFWDCCGDYFEGFNDSPALLCYDANLPFSNITDGGSTCTVSCVTPTPTPTPTTTPAAPSPTPTPTPTPSPCVPDCCEIELCVGGDCSEACSCVASGTFYLSMPCGCPGNLQNATGIFEDDRCGTPAREGFYSDGSECYYWDGSSSLSYQSNC